MKLQSIADKSLKAMVKSFSSTGKAAFDLDYFKNLFPDESDDTITKGLYLLEHDHLATIQPGDGIAYMTFLSPVGIRKCQEDTLLKKGYSCIKEIKSLIG